MSIDGLPALAVRGVEGRGRRAHPGVRPLLRHAHRGTFRGGCLTGPHHSGVELHGFLSYLVHTALREGAVHDLRLQGEAGPRPDPLRRRGRGVLGLRPGPAARRGRTTSAAARQNAASLLECVELIADASGGKRPVLTYDEQARVGDHICYYTDMAKFRGHFPGWRQECTTSARSSTRWSAPWPPSSADEPAACGSRSSTSSTPRTSAPPRSWPRRSPSTGPRAATRSRWSPAGPGYLEGLAPAGHRARPARAPDPPGRGRPTSASRRPRRRLVGYVSFLGGAASRLLLLPRQDVIVSMTTPPFVVLVRAAPQAGPPPTRVVLWSMDCYPDAAERFGELRTGGRDQPGAPRRQPLGVPAPRPRRRASTARWPSCSRRSTRAGPGPAAGRRDPELGAAGAASRAATAPSRGPATPSSTSAAGPSCSTSATPASGTGSTRCSTPPAALRRRGAVRVHRRRRQVDERSRPRRERAG